VPGARPSARRLRSSAPRRRPSLPPRRRPAPRCARDRVSGRVGLCVCAAPPLQPPFPSHSLPKPRPPLAGGQPGRRDAGQAARCRQARGPLAAAGFHGRLGHLGHSSQRKYDTAVIDRVRRARPARRRAHGGARRRCVEFLLQERPGPRQVHHPGQGRGRRRRCLAHGRALRGA